MDTERDIESALQAPVQLEISHRESADEASKIDQTRDFAGAHRVRVQSVRRDRHGHDHVTKDIHAPAEYKRDPDEVFLQRLADEDKPRNDEESREINGRQSSFRLKLTGVLSNVTYCEQIVDIMAEKFAKDDRDDWGEEKEPDGFFAETIASSFDWCCEENRGRLIYANCPLMFFVSTFQG